MEIATFAGGCFWCIEAIFKRLKGVVTVVSGYCQGAESVQIRFDPKVISYETLLDVFWHLHDPTTVNQQGNDVGTQYRSAIFYHSPEQKKIAEDFIKEINNSSEHGAKVVTELVLLDTFYEAENYHRDYFATHPGNPYCEVVINPKLEKVQKQFASLLANYN